MYRRLRNSVLFFPREKGGGQDEDEYRLNLQQFLNNPNQKKKKKRPCIRPSCIYSYILHKTFCSPVGSCFNLETRGKKIKKIFSSVNPCFPQGIIIWLYSHYKNEAA